MKISRIISIFAVFFIYFFFYFIVFNHQAIASNCSNEEQCQNDSNCAAGEHCNKGSICADTICGGCTVMFHQWTCQGNATPRSSSSSSSQSSSAPTGICTKGTTICADGNRYSCRLDYLQNKTYWLWGGTCVFQNCDPTHDWKCEDGHNKQCYKQTTDNRTFFATFYNNSCSFSNCAPLDENQTKCENGIGYWCRKGLSPQTYWEQFSSSFCESSCTINQQKCENGIGYNCFRDNLKHTNFWVRFSPCSFEGYPAAPARPGDSSFSSSSSSQVSLSQDNVPPNPAKDVRVEFIHGNGTTIDDSIKFSWAWNGDRTCDGCEPAVEYCAFVKPTPGGPLITGYSTGRSTGPTPFPCNPDEFGPFWWQIVNESTGQVYKQFYSGAQNIQNIMKGLTINVLDNQGRLYPPGGTTYAVVCTDDESFNNRHDVFRIDIETRDARGKITGLQGSTYPNIKSIKASCCFSQAMGNADCNKNTDNSPIIDNSDFTIWKEEYLSTRLTKWSDFDTNSVVALKDFEIWRHNRYDPNP